MNCARVHLWAALALLLTPLLSVADEVEWLVAPYVWLSDITLDQSSGPGGTISASDLLDKSDSVGMIRVEAARNHWGFTLDYVFLSVSGNRNLMTPGPLPINISVIAELDTDIVELGGFYRPSGGDSGVQYLFGIRNINVEQTLLVTPSGGITQRFDSDPSFTDVFGGLRYLHRFNDKWDLALRGDYSFGDTEGTLNLLASVGYRFNSTFALNLGYRHLAIEFEDSSSGVSETTDIEMSGPLLGFLFRF